MGETANIAKMAELVSKDIFEYLGWERAGSQNINWECVKKEHGRKTHPADAVYQYNEPYENKVTYVLCDFKSYAKESITKKSLEKALVDLNNSISCAKISRDWSTKFRSTEKYSDVVGMLFIYNHDNKFDYDFNQILIESSKKLKVDPGNVIYVMGPREIEYFTNMTENIQRLIGKRDVPSLTHFGFYYPELPNLKICHDASRLPLIIEHMSGSTHIIRYGNEVGGDIVGFDIYSRNSGEDVDYFLYILDYLRKFNCLQENKKVRIFMPFAGENASIYLDQAKKRYVENIDKTIEDKLKNNVSYVHMSVITKQQYFSVEIGMRGDS